MVNERIQKYLCFQTKLYMFHALGQSQLTHTLRMALNHEPNTHGFHLQRKESHSLSVVRQYEAKMNVSFPSNAIHSWAMIVL